MGKLNVTLLRYMNHEEMRVLTAVCFVIKLCDLIFKKKKI